MPELLGYIGAFLTTVSFLPQAIKTIKSRDTDGISFLMYLMFVVGIVFWLAYGILTNHLAIIIGNAITTILAGIILMIKIQNLLSRKDHIFLAMRRPKTRKAKVKK
jgi:MtN3 and saliva related transmembrane protein